MLITCLQGEVILIPPRYFLDTYTQQQEMSFSVHLCGLMLLLRYTIVMFTMYYFVLLSLITITLKRQPRPGSDLEGHANLRRLQQHKNKMKILLLIVSAFSHVGRLFSFTAYAVGYLSVSFTDFLKFSRDSCLGVNIFASSFCPLLSTGINPTILFMLGSRYRKASSNE